MAQAVRHAMVEHESLLSQANKHAQSIHNEAHGHHKPGSSVPAEKLNYDECEGWKITKHYAALMGSSKLGVQGECSADELVQLYLQGSFELMLGNNCSIDEVELKLTLPDGFVQTSTEDLKTYPTNKRILLKVGEEFFNGFESGNIKFELNGTESETLKKGLVIFQFLFRSLA